MPLKETIKLFIPPILLLIRNRLKNRVSEKTFFSNIGQIQKSDDTLIVIGNGPSFAQSIKKYERRIAGHDCIVVNHFCETEYYELLKPKFYLLADPAFWGDLESFAQWQRDKINGLIKTLVKKTEWDISFIVPSAAKETILMKRLESNLHIHPFYYNCDNFAIENDYNKWSLWDRNLVAPPAQTCLNTCVYFGIFSRYKEIYLIGADTSWTEEVHVDQNTNEVYIDDEHFYGKKRMTVYIDSAGKIPSTLHKQLYSNANALKLYWDLKDYADYAGVKVFNASEYSLIDAFERKKLSSCPD